MAQVLVFQGKLHDHALLAKVLQLGKGLDQTGRSSLGRDKGVFMVASRRRGHVIHG